MFYAYLADLVVFVHVLYAAFVVVGFLLIVIGMVLNWKWIRNFWFRLAHMIAIGIVAIEEVWNVRCPLTVWEEQLRVMANQAVTGETFMTRFMRSALFWDCSPTFFTMAHLGIAMLILATFVIAPPRLPGSRKAQTA